MRVYVDTSAIFSIIDRNDEYHSLAAQQWTESIDNEFDLVTTNYVIVEAYTLLQRRLGLRFLQACHNQIVPMLRVHWVDEDIHQKSVTALLTANRRQLSFVDCVSFTICRELNIQTVFCFDPHFQEQGFRLLSLVNLG